MKKRKRHITISLLVIIAIFTKVSAQTPFYLMNNSGTLYSFVLEEKPRFWHSSSLLHVQTESIKINFVLNKVSQIFWDNDIPTSISPISKKQIDFVIRDNKIYISGDVSSGIYIYSMKGILCSELHPLQEEEVVVDISGYEKGTYLVKITDFTFKFIKQ